MTPSTRAPSADHERRAAAPGDRRRRSRRGRRARWPPRSRTHARTESAAPLRMTRPSPVDAAHAGRAENGHELGAWVVGGLAVRARWRRRRWTRPRVSRRPGWTAAPPRPARGFVGAGDSDERGRHPVPVGDRAGLVEQQRRDVTGRLDGPARHGQHVALHERGPCRRCRSPTAGRRWWSGARADQQADQHGPRLRACATRPDG